MVKSVLFVLLLIPTIASTKTQETHRFKLTARSDYRCFSTEKMAKDSFTKESCERTKHSKSFLNDEVSLVLKPVVAKGSINDKVGSFNKVYKFKGREFRFILSIYRSGTDLKYPYNIRAVTKDNEYKNRVTDVYLKVKDIKDLPPFSLQTSSMDTKEEIKYQFFIEAL